MFFYLIMKDKVKKIKNDVYCKKILNSLFFFSAPLILAPLKKWGPHV